MTTNEETLYKNSTQENVNAQSEQGNVNDSVTSGTEENKKDNTTAKRAAAVAAGLVAGGGVAYAIDSIGGDDQPVVPATTDDDTMKVTTEDDSLSFDEAFNDARAQVGPGGAFRWHGGIYNTYTENEWNNMSDAEKAEYNAKVAPLASGSERMESTYAHNSSQHTGGTSHINEHHERTENVTTKVVIEQEDNFHITSEEHGEIQGHDVIIGHGTHNGQEMVVVDVERDGKYDFIVEDANQDGQISDNEVVDISGRNIEVGNQELLASAEEVHPVEPGPNIINVNGPIVEITAEGTGVINGKEVIVGEGTYDGHTAAYIDVNKDGAYDIAAVDVNDNGDCEENEFADIRGEGIRVEDRTLVEDYNSIAQNDPSVTDTNLDDPNQGLPDYAPDCV